MQKVQIIEAGNVTDLQNDINEFTKTHHIDQISYAVIPHRYGDKYSCCILYSEKKKKKNYLTNF